MRILLVDKKTQNLICTDKGDLLDGMLKDEYRIELINQLCRTQGGALVMFGTVEDASDLVEDGFQLWSGKYTDCTSDFFHAYQIFALTYYLSEYRNNCNEVERGAVEFLVGRFLSLITGEHGYES